MKTLLDFVGVYRLYRRATPHSRSYCARIAWNMAVHKTPF